jgi:4'-phosphopantetheinyl transferase
LLAQNFIFRLQPRGDLRGLPALPAGAAVAFLVDTPLARTDVEDSCLTPEERARALRYAREEDRLRFLRARQTLRHLLGHYLEQPPSEVAIETTPLGKPVVDAPLHFNLAHSGRFLLLALSRDCALGVDIEEIDPSRDPGSFLAALHPSERAQFGDSPADAAGVLRRWVRKEALLKAAGVGLEVDPRSFALPAEACPQPVRLHGIEWTVHDIDPGPGAVAALAACAPRRQAD